MSMSYSAAKAALMRLFDLGAEEADSMEAAYRAVAADLPVAPSPAGFRSSVRSFVRRGGSDYGRFLRDIWFA